VLEKNVKNEMDSWGMKDVFQKAKGERLLLKIKKK
jgi:hypothetical protein